MGLEGQNTTTEVLYKSPRDIINALDKRSDISDKRLANKIRGIFREKNRDVGEETSDAMQALRDSLPAGEVRQIESTLATKVFDGTTPFSADAMKKIEEAEKSVTSISDMLTSFTDSFEVSMKLLSEFKFAQALKVLFAGFTGDFSLDLWNSEGVVSKLEAKKEKEKKKLKGNESLAGSEVDFTTKLFIEYVYGNGPNKDLVTNVCQKIKFSDLKFSEIQELSQDDTKLQAWINEVFEGKTIELKIVKEAFKLFANGGKGKETVKGVLKGTFDEGLRFKEAMKISNKDLGIFGHINSLNPDDLFSKGYEGLVNFNMDIFTGNGSERMNHLGISTELGSFILNNTKIKSNITESELDALMIGTRLSDVDKAKCREIIGCGREMQNEIATNQQINLGTNFSKKFDSSPLSIIEMVEMYIVLGKETAFSSMNEFKQTFMYFATLKILDNGRGGNANGDQGAYMVKLADLIKDSMTGAATDIKIPDGVINFMKNVGGTMIDKVEQELISLGFNIGGGLKQLSKTSPEVLGVIIGIILLYPFPMRKNILGRIFLPDLKFSKRR